MNRLFLPLVAGISFVGGIYVAPSFLAMNSEKSAIQLRDRVEQIRQKQQELMDDASKTNAICILRPDGNSGVSGLIKVYQAEGIEKTIISGKVTGLPPNTKHGFHIHEFGDLTQGCVSAGAHYNPLNKAHGGRDSEERHVGDLGNIVADENGVAEFKFEDALIRLRGNTSVVGRSFVVHKDEDDLGLGNFPDSKTTGHAGARVACGVIALAKNEKI